MTAAAAPGTPADGAGTAPAAGSWPWRQSALLLCLAAQLITISALESADPVPVTWAAVLLAFAPAAVAALAAFAPARFARLAAVLGVVVLVAGAVLLPVTGVAVTEIAVRGRRQHQAAARRAGYLDAINS